MDTNFIDYNKLSTIQPLITNNFSKIIPMIQEPTHLIILIILTLILAIVFKKILGNILISVILALLVSLVFLVPII